MSTRAQVRFATREDGVSFSEHPEKINAQFYVHSDGYPEGLGLQIADSIENYCKVNNLLTFLPDEYHPDGRTDFYYGDYLLQKEYQV